MTRIAWILALAACGGGMESKPEPPAAPAPDPPVVHAVLEGRFVEPLRDAARAYLAWGRVDERMNIAPAKCAMPTRRDYGSTGDVRLSSAGDDSPHGKKLYYLYANPRSVYIQLERVTDPLPIGTTVVKESFASRIATEAEVDAMTLSDADVEQRYRSDEPAPGKGYVISDGTPLVPDGPLGLYIMTKVGDADEPDTDAGWIYGTITPDGAVTSAGRVGSCMSCHVDQAPHERLFGVYSMVR
jgi:hypothetical protein